jgi:hypothetical protein
MADDNNTFTGINKFGSSTDYSQFAVDGTLTQIGNATTYKDELGRLSGAKLTSPSSKVVQDDAEGKFYYKDTATMADYLWLNIQLNHDRKLGAAIYPHLHWEQSSANIPNWLIEYRYQTQGQPKTTAWSNIAYSSHAFTYNSGSLNQITIFPAITPTGDGVSDILQIRIERDTANASGKFGADPLVGNAYVVDIDVHKECSALGSNVEYQM